MTALRALLSIPFVAVVIGVALGAIFVPLMRFERAMQNEEAYQLLIKQWIGCDLALTIFLCRRDILFLLRGK